MYVIDDRFEFIYEQFLLLISQTGAPTKLPYITYYNIRGMLNCITSYCEINI